MVPHDDRQRIRPLSSPRLVFVCAERPHPASPLGRARRTGRVAEHLRRLSPRGELAFVPIESGMLWQPGGDSVPTGWRDRVASELQRADGVVVDLGAAVALAEMEAARDLPAVVMVDHLPSLAVSEASGHDQTPEARLLLAQHLHQRERLALERARTVICFSEPDAARVASMSADIDPLVFIASSPSAAEREFFAREGAFAFGAFASEPGHPDAEGLATLRDEVAPALADAGVTSSVEVVAEDIALGFRALGPHLRWRPATDWSAVLGERVVAISARPFAGTTPQAMLDVALAGLPFVATPASVAGLGLTEALVVADSPEEMANRATELLQEQKRWLEVQEALRHWSEALTSRHPVDQVGAAILETFGIAAEPTAPTAAPAPAVAFRFTPPSGTLAAAASTTREFEEELLGQPALDRLEAHRLLLWRAPDDRYRLWRTAIDDPDRLSRQRERAASFAYRPKVSVLVPVYDTRPDLLAAVLDSLQDQTYDHWEVCAVDDGSPTHEQYDALRERAAADPRIRVQRLDENQGIAGASNAALAMATGDFVALVDHDDLLYPDALYWVVRRLQDDPDPDPDLDLVYTDWDKVDDDGNTHLAFLKPDWSPDLFFGVNYLIHFAVVRRSLMEEVDGWRAGYEGAQDFELFLRVTERTDRIAHVAKPLYRWRVTAGSTAETTDAKPHAHEAGRRALEDALARRGVDASVEPGHVPTHFRVRYARKGDPLVSIVIPTRDRVDLLRRCITELREATSYPNYELVVIDNQSEDPATLDYLADLAEGGAGVPARVVPYPHPFNYSRQMNLGAAESRGDLILMLNNDISEFSPEWLDALAEHGQRAEVGVVGARLRFPDGRAQHEGITLADLGGPAANLDGGGYFTYGNHVRNCLAVTGACLMTRPGVFWGVGGFDEGLRVAWNDVDFCLRVGERGWRVVYTPYAELVHPESASRGPLDPAEDRARFEDRWGPPGTLRDPFFHAGLDLLNPLMFRL